MIPCHRGSAPAGYEFDLNERDLTSVRRGKERTTTNSGFVLCQDYDKDNIKSPIIDKIRKVYISNPEFTPAKAANASAAAEGLCKWIIAMDKYDTVAKVVAPKKAKLMAAEAQYEEVMVGLREKQADLKGILAKLQDLEDDLDYNMLKKENLQV